MSGPEHQARVLVSLVRLCIKMLRGTPKFAGAGARRYRKSSAPSSVAGHDAGSIDADSDALALTTASIMSSSARASYSVAFALEPATATQSSLRTCRRASRSRPSTTSASCREKGC